MPFDGIFMSNVCRELSAAIGSRVDKIYQPTREDIVLSLSSRGFKKKLLISVSGVGARIQFTEYTFENPATPPMFCMLMRKHFSNAKLEAIDQNGLDRVITLRFSAFNELGDEVELSIVTELFGRRSNIILTCDGRIMDAVRRSDPEAEGRLILPGAKYELPEPQNKLSLLECDDAKIIHSMALENASFNDTLDGVSPLISRELEELSSKNGVHKALSDVREYAQKGVPTMLLKGGSPTEFTYMPITQYGEAIQSVQCGSFSELLDSFYGQRQKNDDIRRRTHDLRKLINALTERTARRIEKQRGELSRCDDMEKLRVFGELLKANLYAVQPGATFAELPNYYDPECALIRVPLKPELSPSQNAQRYFKEYRKANTARDMLTRLIAEGERELVYLGSVSDELNRAESERELAEIRTELEVAGYIRVIRSAKQKNQKPLPPLRFCSDDGFDIWVGRNNRQNDELTLKVAAKSDIWLHTKGIHGTHTVISANGREVPNSTILQAAILAAYHSDGKQSSSVPVDYCPIRNIKKPSGSPAGMVIYDNYRTVYVTPDEELVNRLKK